MENKVTTTNEPSVSRARNSKSSYKLKVSCLISWLHDHKAHKPKPTILPENVDVLSEKFVMRKPNRNR